MADASIYSGNQLGKLYGMTALQYGEDAYPGLAGELFAIYRDRIAHLPGVPANWLAGVAQYHGQNGYVLVPIPRPQAIQRPDFLNDPTSGISKAWADAATGVQSAVQKYGAKMQVDGAAQLQAAYDDVAYWTRLESIARFLAIPATAAGNILGAASPTLLLIGAGAVALALFMRKGK